MSDFTQDKSAPSLSERGEAVGRSIKISGWGDGRRAAAALKADLGRISARRSALELKWQGLGSVPGGVRWLLDNYYLARREALTAAADLGRGGRARECSGGDVLGVCCSALAAETGLEPDEAGAEEFLRGFQRACVLDRRELSLLGAGLRAALIHALAEACAEAEAPEREGDFRAIFTSLRWLSTFDLTPLTERIDPVEQTLRLDPAGVYPQMDEETREYYRECLSELARGAGATEHQAAERVLSLARGESGLRAHVGYWIFRKPLGGCLKRRSGAPYMAANILITLFFSLLAAFAADSAAAFFLIIIPMSRLVKAAIDFAVLRIVTPCRVPRLELADGVPESGRTLCVVSALLASPADGEELAKRAEEYRLANRDCGKNLMFGILADLPENGTEDAEAVFAPAAAAVEALNAKYGGGFYLFTRPAAWERKRGAVEELMRLICGEASSLECAAGGSEALAGVKFLITLDSDTHLDPGSARRLIGAMLHPLNRPTVDKRRRVVVSGHGVISPRIAVELGAASRSDFARIYAGQGGTDPYGAACGEVYMDLARSGGYPGKGIVDIAAYRAVMAGRIPQGRVLSHDALEGAFLRAGFMGDTELTDGFPSGFLPWLRRQHRWIRGDWQNAPWIFARGRELRDIERYRLADSLRRSLEPVMTFAAIYLGFFLPQGGGALAALTALAACASELLGSLAASLTRPDGERRLRWHSAVLHGVGGGLVRTLVRLILLPAEAWFAFSAIVTALWRMCVTGKNLLAWQTAQQADSAKSGAGRYCLALWPAAVLGLAAAALSPAVIGRAAGVIWALSPLCALILSAKQPEERQAAESEREYLLAQSEKIWSYFDRFVTREDNFLPPDNFQFRPPVGLARRTSPTNIGLFLLSALTALDLGLTARERFASLAGGCLDTLERLEKWRGHLYNWYDTATLAPLRPRYVSTVDSGNLCACLAALETGLDEYGFSDLARRAGALAAEMDFAPLFDGEKKLFFIGYDADSGQMTPSWYDLMASEAMLTGFLAVARGDVTRKHWRQLSRAQVQKNGYRGMASWTGTMFEYLMPPLLLPVYRDSLIYESVRFCVYAQRRRQGPNGVWGISESAFWALDPGMSYRYKAHGVQALALRRGMDAETVVSPYSSFLALAVSPKAAVANLRRLESMGLACDFGFCEAIDFTRGDGRGVVGCVMSHHLGMSLVAAGNYLTGGAMPRRFMSRPEMAAHALLLQEKVPVGGAVLRRGREGEAPPERRVSEERWSESGAAGNFRRPHCCLLAGMSYALAVTDTGVTLPRWGGVVPYAVPRGRSDEGHGVELDFDCGGARLPLLPTLGGEGRFERRFSASCAAFCGFFDGFSSEVSVMLSPDEAAEKRTVSLVPSEGTALRGRVRLTLRAVLGRWQDYLSHPAFAQLGISARAENGCLIMRRLARGGKDKELYLCIACDRPCRFDAAEGVATGRAQPEPLGAGERFLSSGLVCCSAEAELSAGAFAVSFAVGAAHTGDDARAVALRALELTAETAGAMPRSAARVLGMDESELGEVWRLLPELVFPPAAGAVRREELWRFGVSGDLPIVCAEYEKPEQLTAARRLMDKHLLICGCGADFDLVFITHDGAGYRKPLNDALSEALWRSGGEALQSARGGVHIVEECPEADAFRRCAARIVSLDGETETENWDSEPAAKPLPAPDFVPSAHAPEVSWAPDGTVSFSTASALPPRSWANILTNGSLGCLATDCGTGHMWHLNSRENQLSPWLGDPNSSLGAETLCAEAEGRLVSLFAAPDGLDCRVEMGFDWAAWEKSTPAARFRVTRFVPPDADACVTIIERS
ncbi:MAG: hypothetical protein LUC20_05040, partial [Oscillospiraceae bacterium]|nr:hypothetical protein [Oscillospiraceae bacterium]